MDELLRSLLNRLDEIAESHEEIFDSECRDRMGDAIIDGFVRNLADFQMPDYFGLESAAGNDEIRLALANYIQEGNRLASSTGLNSLLARLSAFQNPRIRSDEGNFYDDFFGYCAPENFDESGH